MRGKLLLLIPLSLIFQSNIIYISFIFLCSYLYHGNNILGEKNVCHMIPYGPLQYTSTDVKHSSMCSRQGCIDQVIENTTGTYFGHLWYEASTIATNKREIVILLVTEGYADIFSNFLCFIKSSESESLRNFNSFLVLTPSQIIYNLSKSNNIASLLIPQNQSIYVLNITDVSLVNFGTLLYQQILFKRTQIVFDLLLLGFTPIVADIDTVWLRNPLDIIHLQRNYDIFVTKDKAEICGGFIYLNNTENTVVFWSVLLNKHQALIEKAINNNNGRLEDFFMSEQKELTKMILGGKDEMYQDPLQIYILSTEHFPNGYDYFNLRLHKNSSQSVVIHNNYMIGKELKRSRFEKYGLWKLQEFQLNVYGSNNILGLQGLNCSYGSLSMYDELCFSAIRDIDIPTVSLMTPVHDSHLTEERISAQLYAEGYPRDSLFAGKLWVDADPPSYLPIGSLFVSELNVPQTLELLPFTATLDNSNIAVSIDTSVAYGDVMGIDYGGHRDILMKAGYNAHMTYETSLVDDFGVLESMEKLKASLSEEMPEHSNNVNEMKGKIAERSFELNLRFTIQIITYKRAQSLLRLLTSLENADYGDENVPLTILIDGMKGEKVHITFHHTLFSGDGVHFDRIAKLS